MAESRPPDRRRRIRSFVRRPGRLTPAQSRALTELLPKFRLDPGCLDLRDAFAGDGPVVVEIGFGNGQALAWMAANEPDKNFLGIEVHEPGVGRLLRTLAEREIVNVRVAMDDAVEVLRDHAVPASVDEIRIFFPDPWPKKRHHKRRLIQSEFATLATDRLRDGGMLHLATDWKPYAEQMLEVLSAEPALENLGNPAVERPSWRPRTRFERRGEGKGHQIMDLLFRKVRRPPDHPPAG